MIREAKCLSKKVTYRHLMVIIAIPWKKGRAAPQAEEGTLQVGIRLSPIKVPPDQKSYMVSFERNRGIRCFDLV